MERNHIYSGEQTRGSIDILETCVDKEDDIFVSLNIRRFNHYV